MGQSTLTFTLIATLTITHSLTPTPTPTLTATPTATHTRPPPHPTLTPHPQRRRDASLRHVVISEKFDKKASKFHAESVPFGFDSRETYEHSVRQPVGRETNTDAAFR